MSLFLQSLVVSNKKKRRPQRRDKNQTLVYQRDTSCGGKGHSGGGKNKSQKLQIIVEKTV